MQTPAHASCPSIILLTQCPIKYQTPSLCSTDDPDLSLRNTTLGQTAIDTLRNIGRDQRAESIDISSINSDFSTSATLDDLILQSEELLSDLSNTWILRWEGCDENGVSAVGVEFGVYSSLREDSHLELVESVVEMSGAVLGNDGGEKTAFDNEIQFCGAGMDVRSVEAAGTEESDCDSSALPNESREGSVIGTDNLSTFTLCDTGGAGVVCEIEDEILVFEESEAVDGVGSEDELLEESQATCTGCSAWYGDVGWCTRI